MILVDTSVTPNRIVDFANLNASEETLDITDKLQEGANFGDPIPGLNAAELALIHPITAQPLRFRMPLPADLKAWLLKLRTAPQPE